MYAHLTLSSLRLWLFYLWIWSEAFFKIGSQGGGCWVVRRCRVSRHRGVQLILAYSLARPAILVAARGRRGLFLFLLFLHFYSCSFFFPVPLFHLFYCLFYLFSPVLWETTQNDPQGLTCRLTPIQSINQNRGLSQNQNRIAKSVDYDEVAHCEDLHCLQTVFSLQGWKC